MSYAPYLSSVAEALMKRVHSHVTDVRARDALEACVRALAGMAAALDAPRAEDVAGLRLPAGLNPGGAMLPVNDPPENLAANEKTAARIAIGAEWLGSFPWLGDRQTLTAAKAMLDWERRLIQLKVDSMYAVEDQSTVPTAIWPNC